MNKRYVFHKPPWSGYCGCRCCGDDRNNLGNYFSKWDRREARFFIDKELEEYELEEKCVPFIYNTEDEDLILLTDEEERLLEQIFGKRL